MQLPQINYRRVLRRPIEPTVSYISDTCQIGIAPSRSFSDLFISLAQKTGDGLIRPFMILSPIPCLRYKDIPGFKGPE